MTVILLTCAYDDREFVRVGYYVNNEYLNDDGSLVGEEEVAALGGKIDTSRVRRNILAEKPRVTRFNIKWDSEESAPAEFPPEQPDVDAAEDDEAAYGADEPELDEEEVEVEAGEGEAVAKAEDADMEGVETNGKEEDEDDDDDAGSEDIENESEDDEDEEELEEEEGEANGEQDMEMEDGDAGHGAAPLGKGEVQHEHQHADVMVH